MIQQRRNGWLPYRTANRGFDLAASQQQIRTARRAFVDQDRIDPFAEYKRLVEGLIDLPAVQIVPLKDLFTVDAGNRRIVSLRLDVDVDPYTALRMARFNARYGVAASVYLLHTAGYYGRPCEGIFCRNRLLRDWVKAFVVAGCELGLHTDPLGLYLAPGVLGLYIKQGIDGCEAVRVELEHLRRFGADICGTVAHNSYPAYGAENFEVFSERVIGKRTKLKVGKKKIRLGRLDESSLGLTYEGNYAEPPSRGRWVGAAALRKSCEAWKASTPRDSVEDEAWMRTYMLENPYFRRRYEGLAWHHGGGRWSWAVRDERRGNRWRWQVDLQTVLSELAHLPPETRTVFLLHPIYFAGDAPDPDEELEKLGFCDAGDDNQQDESTPSETAEDAADGPPLTDVRLETHESVIGGWRRWVPHFLQRPLRVGRNQQ